MLEELMGIMLKIIEFLLEDIMEKFDQVGVKPNPLTEEEKAITFGSQMDAFMSSSRLFPLLLDHFKDAVECFFILCRQKDRALLENDVNVVLQMLERGRYNIGELIEEFRQLEASYDEKVKLEREFVDSSKGKKQMVSAKVQEVLKGKNQKSGKQNQDFLNIVYMINELHKKKFTNTSQKYWTRESKINLKNE
jgi:uncharacterized protein YktA (UPF0223 family)